MADNVNKAKISRKRLVYCNSLNISKEKQEIIKKINNLDDDQIKILKKCLNKMDDNNINEKPKNININIDKTTDKYKILLKYVNGILKNMNKNEIDDLTDFKDIDRLYIIKDENIKLLNSLAPELFKYFNKDKCGFYRKTKNIALNVLRGMCKEIGLVLKKRQFTKSVKSKNITHISYSIY